MRIGRMARKYTAELGSPMEITAAEPGRAAVAESPQQDVLGM